MVERFNLRVLDQLTPEQIKLEIARIESYPERVAAVAPKGSFLLIHATGLRPIAAMILKQELIALDADCVLSPAAYLGEDDGPTDVLIMATLRQYRQLIPRLKPFPIGDLFTLAAELETTLANYYEQPQPITLHDRSFGWGERTYVMGILNITPDSFSGDGLAPTSPEQARDPEAVVAAAVEQAQRFVADGADILDIGGESTRPGATTISVEEEIARVTPVIAAVRASVDVPISADTWKAEVAAAALDAGADLINDVWGLRTPDGDWNHALANLVAARNVPLILMHNRRAQATTGSVGGHYATVQYQDMMGEILSQLRASKGFADQHGILRERIIIDPGIGFGKTPTQNIELLQQLGQLRSLGRPILLGTSRKSFIGRALQLGPSERAEGTAATVTLGIQAGVDIVRVHDVTMIARVARMTDAIVRPGAWERMLLMDNG